MPPPSRLTSPALKASPALNAVLRGERVLRRGDKGTAVGALQRALAAQGFFVPTFDAATEAAVRAFQAAKGVGVDGTVGPTTLGLLDAAQAVPPAERIHTVVDRDARIRSGPPGFRWDGRSRIRVFTRVRVRETQGKHARVVGLTPIGLYGVTPGRYRQDPPRTDCPEFLLVARR